MKPFHNCIFCGINNTFTLTLRVLFQSLDLGIDQFPDPSDLSLLNCLDTDANEEDILSMLSN